MAVRGTIVMLLEGKNKGYEKPIPTSVECDHPHSFLIECSQDGCLGHNTLYLLIILKGEFVEEACTSASALCFILSKVCMELGELIEELQKIECRIGGAATVYVQTGVDEVELYDIGVRSIDDATYEVVVKGRL